MSFAPYPLTSSLYPLSPMHIYLDHNATTPLLPEVADAVHEASLRYHANPGSQNEPGRQARRALEEARLRVGELLGARTTGMNADRIIFTSGGTEANNHAIQGIAWAMRAKGNHIITSAVEHPAVLEVCRFLAPLGFEITILPVNDEGLVDPEDVQRAIRPKTILITIMHANNEVGAIQPLAEIGAIARDNNITFHTDAAQSVGKIPTLVDELKVDLLSIAGHKLYAPKGVGALYIRHSCHPAKFCHGAGQERGWRAGTENVMQIVGLGRACALAAENLKHHMTEMQMLRDRLFTTLSRALPEIQRNGPAEKILPNTLNLSFKGVTADRILERIAHEVAASAGAACHSDTVEISHVLQAMHIPVEWAKGTIRFSVGRMTTGQQIDRAAEVVIAAVKKARGNHFKELN
ncbi:MAG: cysteine desulfurase [Desulfobulbaceae bacterium]|nr:cysteine desulfurase [Desulfobulbaceae bacterium]